MRRGPVLALVLGAVVVAAGIGWYAGSKITSPAEVAARAEPPEPSLITVSVEQTTLSADVIARGDIQFDDPVSVELSGAIGDPAASPVVTRIAAEGDQLEEGAVMIEVAGRPVFLLQGQIPAFRDMRPEAEGIDIRQLEEALARLGHFAGAPDNVWTGDTGAAVQAMYSEAGYRANAADDSEQAALDAARDQVESSAAALADAERALANAAGASRSEVLAAEAEVEFATDALELARLEAKGANDAAGRETEAAEAAVTEAVAALEVAQARLREAEAGTHPDTGVPPTPEELAQLAADVADAEDSVAQSEALAAQAAQFEAETEARQAATVRQAESNLEIAQARLAEVKSPPDRTFLRRAVNDARDQLSRAQSELADLESSVGTWIPAGEIVFLERVPVRVDALLVTLGGTVSGPFMTVSGSEIALRVSVREADVERLEVGDVVFVDEEDTNGPLEGEIVSIPDQGTGDRRVIEVAIADIPDELIGSNVRVVIPIESTAGEVLAVPAAALSATADGTVQVEVERSPGETESVRVETGLSAEGLVEIRPVGGDLEEGDRVVVGQAATEDG